MYIGLKAKEREHTEQGNNGPRSSSLPASSTADARVRVGTVRGLMSYRGVLHESLVTTEAIPYHIVI
jgi:hypothetical protein